MLSINGVAIATPKSLEVTISDIDGESNRNANGEMIRDRIGVKRKIALEWPPLTQREISTLYVGDRTAPAYVYDTKTKQVKWSGLKMNFIEK